MRKIVIASDSYKGTLSSREVAAAGSAGVRAVWPEAEVLEVELADGGEGSAQALTNALGGTMTRIEATGPSYRPYFASYGVFGDIAVVEVAQACGLTLLSEEERHPLQTTTFGVGELLVDAWKRGCHKFIICLGGSGTCDGGAGMLSVDGVKDVLREGRFVVACDVDTLYGDAPRVFGPQKGATPEEIPVLEARLARQAEAMRAETGVDVAGLPGGGAAGGLGGAFAAYAGGGFDLHAAISSLGSTASGSTISPSASLEGQAPLGPISSPCTPAAGSTISPSASLKGQAPLGSISLPGSPAAGSTISPSALLRGTAPSDCISLSGFPDSGPTTSPYAASLEGQAPLGSISSPCTPAAGSTISPSASLEGQATLGSISSLGSPAAGSTISSSASLKGQAPLGGTNDNSPGQTSVLCPGIDIILDAVRFDKLIEGADLVITGEGRSDSQTPHGKAPAGVLRRCQAAGVPCALVSGSIRHCPPLDGLGFAAMAATTPPSTPASEWQQPAIAAGFVTSAIQRLITELFPR